MPDPHKTPFTFPLSIGAVEHFCHPCDGSRFSTPRHHQGNILSGSGWIAIQCHRGLWMPTDFEAAEPEFLARWDRLPWHRFQYLADQWEKLDDVRGHLYRRVAITPWNRHHKPANSPIWKVAEIHFVRLSHLQLIARLPRCEVYTGPSEPSAPLFFRFAGGQGVIAHDKHLNQASFSIFDTRRHFDGTHVSKVPSPTFKKFANWPPPEPSDP